MIDIFRPEIISKHLPRAILSLTQRIGEAADFIHNVNKVPDTPLVQNARLSDLTGANVFLKLESESSTGAYKSRGAGFAVRDTKRAITASAGNHAQGFALACNKNQVQGTVFMPVITPDFKIGRTARFGGEYIDIHTVGDDFDSASRAMEQYAKAQRIPIIHPFNNIDVIAGQGTIAVELIYQMQGKPIDFLIVPIGGGGISAGMAAWFALHSPRTQIIAVEPQGADAMKKSMESQNIITLESLDTFVDGAAVRTPGKRNFNILKALPNVHYLTVSSGAVSQEMCLLHDDDKKIVEPAGALSVTALRYLQEAGYSIDQKNIVCVVTGGNIAMERWPDIRRRSNEYLGYEKEFTIAVRNTPGSLRKILEQFIDGNQITLLRFDHLEGPEEVACTLRIRNIREPHRISEFENNIREAGLLWGDRKQKYAISKQTSYPFRKHFSLILPDRPRALLDALRFQGPTINITGFEFNNSGFDKARCSVTVNSRNEEDLLVFTRELQEHGFYIDDSI